MYVTSFLFVRQLRVEIHLKERVRVRCFMLMQIMDVKVELLTPLPYMHELIEK